LSRGSPCVERDLLFVSSAVLGGGRWGSLPLSGICVRPESGGTNGAPSKRPCAKASRGSRGASGGELSYPAIITEGAPSITSDNFSSYKAQKSQQATPAKVLTRCPQPTQTLEQHRCVLPCCTLTTANARLGYKQHLDADPSREDWGRQTKRFDG